MYFMTESLYFYGFRSSCSD